MKNEARVLTYEREQLVNRRDTVAGDFLIEELGFVFVDGGCRPRDEDCPVGQWREFNATELGIADDGRALLRRSTAVYVKHLFLRLANRRPRIQAAANKAELELIIHGLR
jgi:hypothetical protein